MPPIPSRADVWLVDLDPVRGHEQAGRRPAVIFSADGLNHGRSGMTVVLPITSVDKRNPLHVRLNPPAGGLDRVSYVKCEDVRAISTDRLVLRLGRLSGDAMEKTGDLLRVVLEL